MVLCSLEFRLWGGGGKREGEEMSLSWGCIRVKGDHMDLLFHSRSQQWKSTQTAFVETETNKVNTVTNL